MTSLDDLAEFVFAFCERNQLHGVAWSTGVHSILASSLFADDSVRQAALYGFAREMGAADAVGFDPAWRPIT